MYRWFLTWFVSMIIFVYLGLLVYLLALILLSSQLACQNLLPAVHNTQYVWLTSCDLDESGLNCVLSQVCLSAYWTYLSEALLDWLVCGPHLNVIAVFTPGKNTLHHEWKCARVQIKLTKYSPGCGKVSSVALSLLSSFPCSLSLPPSLPFLMPCVWFILQVMEPECPRQLS